MSSENRSFSGYKQKVRAYIEHTDPPTAQIIDVMAIGWKYDLSVEACGEILQECIDGKRKYSKFINGK